MTEPRTPRRRAARPKRGPASAGRRQSWNPRSWRDLSMDDRSIFEAHADPYLPRRAEQIPAFRQTIMLTILKINCLVQVYILLSERLHDARAQIRRPEEPVVVRIAGS